MKTTLRTAMQLLFLSFLTIAARAQTKLDETNLITRLSGLNNLTIDEAGKYFTDQGYTLLSRQIITGSSYSMDLYKYTLNNSYLLTVISGGVGGSGIITYAEEDYLQAVKIITDMGFTPTEAVTPDATRMVYDKGNLRFIIQKKTANNKTFYVMMLNDLAKIVKLAGLKK